MQVDTPPPPMSDTSKRSRPATVNAISEKTWVPAGVLVGVVIAALSVHGAWRGTEGRVDLHDVAQKAMQSQLEDLRTVQERHSQMLANQARTTDLAMLNLQRDVSEMRAAMQRVEEALTPAPGRTGRR